MSTGLLLHGDAVLMDDFQRCSGEHSGGALELSRFRCGVAECLANRCYELGDRTENLIFVGDGGLGLSESVASSCIQGHSGNRVVAAVPTDFAGDHRANALTDRHQTGGLLVKS